MAKYLKNDGSEQFVTYSAEIENLKFNNVRHSIMGCMLGDFDESGKYVVDKEIVRELIEMKKYLIDTIDNVEICHSALKLDKQITFMITYESDKATLSLVEKLSYESNIKINSGTYSDINEYILDTVETSGAIDKNLLYQKWNISEFGGEVLDVFNMDEETLALYMGLVNRFKYLMYANRVLLSKEKELEEIEAEYAINLLAIIEHYPELKKAFDKDLKETLKLKKDFLRIDKPNFVKTFNEILEQTVEKNINVLDEQKRNEFMAEKQNILMLSNVKKRELLDIRSETTISTKGEEISIVKLNTNGEERRMSVPEVATNYVNSLKETFNKKNEEAISTLKGKNANKQSSLIKKLTDEYAFVPKQHVAPELLSNIESNTTKVENNASTVTANANSNKTNATKVEASDDKGKSKKGNTKGSSSKSNDKTVKPAPSGNKEVQLEIDKPQAKMFQQLVKSRSRFNESRTKKEKVDEVDVERLNAVSRIRNTNNATVQAVVDQETVREVEDNAQNTRNENQGFEVNR